MGEFEKLLFFSRDLLLVLSWCGEVPLSSQIFLVRVGLEVGGLVGVSEQVSWWSIVAS
jgi:hypothetical protein